MVMPLGIIILEHKMHTRLGSFLSACIRGFVKAKSRMHVGKYVPSCVCLLRSKIIIPRGITMVLAHSIKRCIVYLIPSKNTIGSCVVLADVIGKG